MSVDDCVVVIGVIYWRQMSEVVHMYMPPSAGVLISLKQCVLVNVRTVTWRPAFPSRHGNRVFASVKSIMHNSVMLVSDTC